MKRLLALVLMSVVLEQTAYATDVLLIPDTAAVAGAADVVVPIDLTTAENLTVLSVTVAFPHAPGLCALLVHPDGILVHHAGRTSRAPLEQPTTCTGGVIHAIVNDGVGGVVIPPGSGTIFTIDLGPLTATGGGSFLFAPTVHQAHNGPIEVSVSGSGGTLTVASPLGCGDVTGDHLVNGDDALRIKQYQVGAIACAGLGHPDRCDVNQDTRCDIGDAHQIARCVAGKIPCTFTCSPPFACP